MYIYIYVCANIYIYIYMYIINVCMYVRISVVSPLFSLSLSPGNPEACIRMGRGAQIHTPGHQFLRQGLVRMPSHTFVYLHARDVTFSHSLADTIQCDVATESIHAHRHRGKLLEAER